MHYNVSPKPLRRRSPQKDFIGFPLRNKSTKPTTPKMEIHFPGRSTNLFRIDGEQHTSSSKLSRLHYPSTSNQRVDESDESATSQSDSGWGTESGGEDDDARQKGKEKNESSWEKAQVIIDQLGESWRSDFNEQVGPIKSEFKGIADQVESLMLMEAQLASALSNQLELYHSDDRKISDHIVEEFGESLEAAVKINDTIRDLQKKIKGLNEQMRKKKESFIHDLAALKAKNLEEIEELKDELSAETDSIPGRIQEAKSTKAEQKQVQLKLAKILSNGLH